MRATDIIQKLNLLITSPTPTMEEMLMDLRMTNYKIRALSGGVESFDFADTTFLSSLWRISKIDSIVELGFNELEDDEKEMVIEFINTSKINTIPARQIPTKFGKGQKSVEIQLEVFKDGDEHELLN